VDVKEQDSALVVVEKAIKKHLHFHPHSRVNFNRIKYDLAFRVYTAIKDYNDTGEEYIDKEETLRMPIFSQYELNKLKINSSNERNGGEREDGGIFTTFSKDKGNKNS